MILRGWSRAWCVEVKYKRFGFLFYMGCTGYWARHSGFLGLWGNIFFGSKLINLNHFRILIFCILVSTGLSPLLGAHQVGQAKNLVFFTPLSSDHPFGFFGLYSERPVCSLGTFPSDYTLRCFHCRIIGQICCILHVPLSTCQYYFMLIFSILPSCVQYVFSV